MYINNQKVSVIIDDKDALCMRLQKRKIIVISTSYLIWWDCT